MAKITAKDMRCDYGEGAGRFTALQDVSFSVQSGEFVCVIGHSGCGKTTLLRAIAGLMRPTLGEARIDGRIVERPGPDRTMVFQQYSLFPWMTAEKNVRFALRRTRRGLSDADARRLAMEHLARVGMDESADKYPFQLSGGMLQRVAIARALAVDADILLLDEPFGAVDARTCEQLQQLLLRLWDNGKEKKTVVFVTHDIDEALLLADRILFMGGGRLIEDFAVPFPRPRCAAKLERSEEYAALKERLLGLFYADEKKAV